MSIRKPKFSRGQQVTIGARQRVMAWVINPDCHPLQGSHYRVGLVTDDLHLVQRKQGALQASKDSKHINEMVRRETIIEKIAQQEQALELDWQEVQRLQALGQSAERIAIGQAATDYQITLLKKILTLWDEEAARDTQSN